MTDTTALIARLGEIEQRANAATPGPWAFKEHANRGFILSQHVRHVNADGVTWHGVAYLAATNDCDERDGEFIANARTDIPFLTAALRDSLAPIDMVLFCPKCGVQHIDAPDERTPDWTNPPHKSHLCHGCGFIWRPADVPTNGVAATKTKGSRDGDAIAAAAASLAREAAMREALVDALTFAEHELRLREPSGHPEYIAYASKAVNSIRAALEQTP